MLFKTPLWHSRWGKQLHPHRAVCREGPFKRLKKDARSISKAKLNPTQLQASAPFNIDMPFPVCYACMKCLALQSIQLQKLESIQAFGWSSPRNAMSNCTFVGKRIPIHGFKWCCRETIDWQKAPKIIIALRRLEITGVLSSYHQPLLFTSICKVFVFALCYLLSKSFATFLRFRWPSRRLCVETCKTARCPHEKSERS